MSGCRRTAYVFGTAVFAIGTAAAQSGYSSPQAQQGCDGQATTTQGYQGFRSANPSQRLQNRTDLSDEAAEMLLNTHQARQAIANGSSQSALRQIDEALRSAQQASNLASAQGLGNLVPIYTEYTQASIIGPIQSARTQQQETGGVEAAGVPAPSVQQVEAQFTGVAVDLPTATQHLQAARTALLNNNQRAADSALSAAEGAVIMVRVERDLPLVKARQNLALAKGMIRRGDFQAARAPLAQAVNALGNYSGPHTAEAEQLQRQIAFSMNNNFGGDQQAAANQIDQWWNQLADFTVSGTTQQQQRQIG